MLINADHLIVMCEELRIKFYAFDIKKFYSNHLYFFKYAIHESITSNFFLSRISIIMVFLFFDCL